MIWVMNTAGGFGTIHTCTGQLGGEITRWLVVKRSHDNWDSRIYSRNIHAKT